MIYSTTITVLLVSPGTPASGVTAWRVCHCFAEAVPFPDSHCLPAGKQWHAFDYWHPALLNETQPEDTALSILGLSGEFNSWGAAKG